MMTETITAKSLREDAELSLEDFNLKKQELEEQIDIFEEALTTARNDLLALKRKYKPMLKKAGLFKTNIQHLIEIVKENPGIKRSDLDKKLSNKIKIAPNYARSLLESAINVHIKEIDGHIFYEKTVKPHGSKRRQIFLALKKRVVASNAEIKADVNFSSAFIGTNLSYLATKNIVIKIDPFTPENPTRYYKYKLNPTVNLDGL